MVSHNKRIVAALAAVAAMGIGLAGCGGSDTAGDTKSGSDGGVVNITYMHRLPDSEGMTLVNDIVAKWNKEHPNIQVKATKFDGNASEMIKKLETDVKAGNAPDLAQVGYAEVPEVFTKGLLQDVTDEAAKYKDDFASGPFALMQVGGKTYGLPQDTGPLTYFYNAAEFEKLGITVPKTADELIETAKKTAAQGKYIMTFQPDEAMMMMSGQAGASGPWYKVDGNSWVVNTQTKGSKAVADVYQQLIDNKAALTNPRWDASFDNSIQSGQLIGTVAAAWEAPLFIDSAGGTGAGEWKVTQLGDWFGNGTKTAPMVVPVWPCSRVPSTRPKPWSSLTGSTPRLMTLSPRASSWPPPPRKPRPRRSGPTTSADRMSWLSSRPRTATWVTSPTCLASPQSALQ